MSASLTLSTDARLPSCVGGRPASASSLETVAPAGAGLSLSVRCKRGVAIGDVIGDGEKFGALRREIIGEAVSRLGFSHFLSA